MKERYKKYFKMEEFHITEAVIFPEEYLLEIQKKINNLLRTIRKAKNLQNLCDKLTIYFSKNKIQFYAKTQISRGIEEYIKFGINDAKTANDKYGSIAIYCNDNLLEIFDSNSIQLKEQFVNWLLFILKHELIHRGQNLSIQDIDLRGDVLKKDFKNKVDYLSDKQEIMARAWEIVELFKLSGYTENEILKLLKTENKEKMRIITLQVYHQEFNINDWQLKLLYKYMYMYLDQE